MHCELVEEAQSVSAVPMIIDEEITRIEKRLERKLDLRLMAVAVIIYVLNFLDRNNIAAAKTIGIAETLHLTSTQYQTAMSILFAGYVIVQVPSNVPLAQIRPSLYLPRCMIAWGILSTCTAAVQNASALYTIRFLIGFVEGVYYPGTLFLISSWYRRSEMGFRCALLYSGSAIGSAFSGLIAAGIQHGLDGSRGLPAWRWLFVVEGSITITIATFAIFVLPNFPHNTRWLSEEERNVAHLRLLHDAGQTDSDESTWSVGFKFACSDWRLYVFALINLGILVTSSTQNFFPSVVGTLGYGRIETLPLTAPPYLVGAVVMIANNLSADKRQNSSYHVIWPLVFAIVGFVLAASTLNTGARYFAMFLMIAGGHSSNAVLVAWTQKTMLRPRIKRAAAVAFVNCFGNSAQIFASYFYPNDGAPRYILAMSANSGFALLSIILTVFMRLVLIRENKSMAQDNEIVEMEMKDEVEAALPAVPYEETLARRAGFRYVT